MIPVRRVEDLGRAALDRVLDRGRIGDPTVERTVRELIESVRARGDAALVEQTERFDGVVLGTLEVPRSVWSATREKLAPDLAAGLETAAASIRRFHEAQRPDALEIEVAPGLVLGRRPDPLQRVGVYAPGGRAAYPSSVLMGVVPARVAGVDEVIVCSPPGPDGQPSPLVTAACDIAGADRLFAVGGAGAVAGMAYGTGSVPRVDRIVGPGNAWVTEAKRQVTAVVGIDSPAGPSELLVLADASADPVTVALELIAQAEHDPDAAVVLVTPDEGVARATAWELERRVPESPRRGIVEASLAGSGALLVVDSLKDGLELARRYAPEHLLLLVEDPRDVLADVRSAGTVFLGPRSSVAYGDYATGANHVLPTGGLARSYSGLSLDDFVRWTTWQEVRTDEAAERLAAVAVPLAEAEGLPGHAAAARSAPGSGSVSRRGAGEGAGKPRWPGPGPRPRRAYRELTAYDPERPALEVDLSANTNLWGSCPAALGAVRDYGAPTGYPSVYAEPLKRAVAEAWAVTPTQVVTGCGSDDIIDSAIRAFCEPGSRVAFPAPTFPMAPVFARMNETRPRPVPLRADGSLDDDALQVLVDADVVYLCRPNNPTGAMVPRERAVELLERARGLVLIDEAYGEYSGETLLGPALESGRGVVLRTLSKAYGLAGLRVGYGLGPEPLVRAIELSRGPYKVSGPGERAAAAALADGWPWVHDIVERTRKNRDRLARELSGRGFGVRPGAANFVLAATGPAGAARLKAGLADRGIGVRAFESLHGVGDAIRVTVGPWPVMERFLEALDGVLAATADLTLSAPEQTP
jgi:histidinol dehydrogenase